MSALALSELSLTEQAQITLAWSRRLEARALALLNPLEAPATPAVVPPVGSAGTGAFIPLPTEETAMVEKMVRDHPPLLVCYPGHRARMWQATGDRAVTFYVECSVCGVRTARLESADAAAHAWGQRQVAPIMATVAA